MVEKKPRSEQSIATNGVAAVTPWPKARSRLARARKYWLASAWPDGRPHVMPVFGVWVDGGLFFTAGESSRKARNLAHDKRCVVTAAVRGLDLVVEGKAVKVRDKAKLHRVAEAYASKYGWHLTVQNGTFFADYGAPSAGAPPYDAYEVAVTTVFGLGTAEPYGATRWRFER